MQSGEQDMDEKGFRDYCARRKFTEETIQLHIKLVREFEEFLEKRDKKDLSDASSNDMKGFVADLMENRKITLENFRALIRYSDFSGRKETVSVLYGYLEGLGVPEELLKRLKETVGERKSEEIFEGVNIPPLGTRPE